MQSIRILSLQLPTGASWEGGWQIPLPSLGLSYKHVEDYSNVAFKTNVPCLIKFKFALRKQEIKIIKQKKKRAKDAW